MYSPMPSCTHTKTADAYAKRDPRRGKRCSARRWVNRRVSNFQAAYSGAELAASSDNRDKVMIHASAAMTLDIYADLFGDDLEAVAVALQAARSRETVGKANGT